MYRQPFVLSLMIFGLLAMASCSTASSPTASEPTSVSAAVANVASKPAYAHSRLGVAVVDLSTGWLFSDTSTPKKSPRTTNVPALGAVQRVLTPAALSGSRSK